MLKMRRFKALNGADDVHSRIVDKIAIYDEGGKQIDCCLIQKDDKGREYYCISNPYDEKGSFSDKPKDAIECIRDGLGDGFEWSPLLGMNLECVVRFINRGYGDSVRHDTIETWEGTKFAYGVKLCAPSSFGGERLVCKNKALMGYGNPQNDVLTFETEAEALSFIDKVNKKVQEYYEEYINIKSNANRDFDYENAFTPLYNKINEKMENGIDSVYMEAFHMLNVREEIGDPAYKMKVVQLVLS